MKNPKQQFAQRLIEAMETAGYEAKPAVLEREFNLRYLGAPMTLHGVRRWLLGETLPSEDKLQVLESWLNVKFEPLRPRRSVPNAIREHKADWRATVPQQEKEALDAFLALPLQQRKIVREVILTFAKAAKAR